MPTIQRIIWDKFKINRRDSLPFKTWNSDRTHLAELFNELGYKTGAEIGVSYGYYSKLLCEKIPDLKLYCVDPWHAHHYYGFMTEEKAEGLYQQAKKNLEGLNVEFVRKKSTEAVLDFKDASLDFVYIDALHDFDNIMLDLIHWTPKVKPGGIVSGHDYMVVFRCGVIPAVDLYTRMHNISLYYVTNEPKASFFWVRE